MPNLFFAKEEIKHAKAAINSFLAETEFNPASKHMTDFLIHLELCFVKAERGCQDIKNSFLPFQGKYKKLRKEDPLLSYLKNARDAVTHDNKTVVDLEIVSRIVVDYVEIKMTDKDGNTKKEKHPMFPAKIKFLPFFINGKTWKPPKIHLEKPLLMDREPAEIAMLGIKFYDDFLSEVERQFK